MYWYEEGVSVRVVRFSERESRSPGCEVILVRSKGGKLRGAATTALLLLALHAGLIHSRLQEWLVYCITSSLGAAYVLCAIVLTVYKGQHCRECSGSLTGETRFLCSPERVVVLRSLGVHVATTYWSGHTSSLFIPHFAISDIIINEAVTMVMKLRTNALDY